MEKRDLRSFLLSIIKSHKLTFVTGSCAVKQLLAVNIKFKNRRRRNMNATVGHYIPDTLKLEYLPKNRPQIYQARVAVISLHQIH